jgi:hypothetical protein
MQIYNNKRIMVNYLLHHFDWTTAQKVGMLLLAIKDFRCLRREQHSKRILFN